MRRWSVLFLLLFLLSLSGCGAAQTEMGEEGPAEPPLTVTVDGVGEEQVQPEKEAEPEEDLPPAASLSSAAASRPQGGNAVVAAPAQKAALLSQQGGILLADLQNDTCAWISGAGARSLYYSGGDLFYTSDSGIFRVTPQGETQLLSEELSYAMRLEDKLYYIRQTDLAEEEALGELWCMNPDGSGRVAILAEEVAGSFCIRDGWVYYIARSDGGLYRAMLFGSQSTELAAGVREICLVTDRAVYYKENSERQALRRVDLRTGANISLGAYGECAVSGETICVMARKERPWGLDNQFTLMSFDDRAQEMTDLLVFENIGTDSLLWQAGDYVYMRRASGVIYRMDLQDPGQEKEDLFSAQAVFADGYIFDLQAGGLAVYDCAAAETRVLPIG